MKHLLDTHTLLWLVDEHDKVSENAKRTYLKNSNEIYLSVASLWEMAIKIRLNKLSIKGTLTKFVDTHVLGNNIKILDVVPEHIFPLQKLPLNHRDPFDRLIVAQCLQEKMVLIGKDKVFDSYGVRRIW